MRILLLIVALKVGFGGGAGWERKTEIERVCVEVAGNRFTLRCSDMAQL
jgi:hypothetical protein